jgi:hypothetical protein
VTIACATYARAIGSTNDHQRDQNGTQIRQYPPDRRRHPCRPDQSACASRRQSLRQDRSIQSARIGQRPSRDSGVIHKIVRVASSDALCCSRDLAQKEGIFVGISAGATFAGALQICAGAPNGSTILCMLPDTGERYLSTPLFADVPVDMTEEELAISHSTQSSQLRRPPD